MELDRLLKMNLRNGFAKNVERFFVFIKKLVHSAVKIGVINFS